MVVMTSGLGHGHSARRLGVTCLNGKQKNLHSVTRIQFSKCWANVTFISQHRSMILPLFINSGLNELNLFKFKTCVHKVEQNGIESLVKLSLC